MLLFINEDRELGDRYLVFGRLIKDAELKNVGAKGTPLLTLKVSTGRNDELVTMNLWSADALAYNGLKKGTTVLAECRESVREYNGKTYKNYTADFFMCADESATPVKKPKEKTVDPEPVDSFMDISSSDLPW